MSPKRNVIILNDSQVSVKVLYLLKISSRSVGQCEHILNNLDGMTEFTLFWIPGFNNEK